MSMGGSISYFVSWRGVFFTYGALSLISTLLLVSAGRKAPSKKNPGSQFVKPYLDLLRDFQEPAGLFCSFGRGNFDCRMLFLIWSLHRAPFSLQLLCHWTGSYSFWCGSGNHRPSCRNDCPKDRPFQHPEPWAHFPALAGILLSRLSSSPVGELVMGVALLGIGFHAGPFLAL